MSKNQTSKSKLEQNKSKSARTKRPRWERRPGEAASHAEAIVVADKARKEVDAKEQAKIFAEAEKLFSTSWEIYRYLHATKGIAQSVIAHHYGVSRQVVGQAQAREAFLVAHNRKRQAARAATGHKQYTCRACGETGHNARSAACPGAKTA